MKHTPYQLKRAIERFETGLNRRTKNFYGVVAHDIRPVYDRIHANVIVRLKNEDVTHKCEYHKDTLKNFII